MNQYLLGKAAIVNLRWTKAKMHLKSVTNIIKEWLNK